MIFKQKKSKPIIEKVILVKKELNTKTTEKSTDLKK